MTNGAAILRRLFAQPGIIRLIGAHNALGAKMAERANFDGVWLSSFEISASHAVPDASILTQSEHLAVARTHLSINHSRHSSEPALLRKEGAQSEDPCLGARASSDKI